MSEPDTTEARRSWVDAPPLGVSLLAWSVIVSCLLHGSFMATALLDFRQHASADIDVEWLKSFDSLEGLGHGSSGRWAEIDAASFETRQEAAEPELAPPEPEPAPPEPAPPEPAPEPKVEPKERPKPKPRPAEAAAATPVAKADKPAPQKPAEVFGEGPLPGLDRAGPNGLPAMEGYGPGNAVFTALVRLDRVRDTPFEEATRTLLEAVPDYRIALHETGIDPLRDLDTMFMASADPRYIDETFLAVRHGMSRERLHGALDRRFEHPIPWTSYRKFALRDLVPTNSPYQDPRKVLDAGHGLALIVRPEWLEELTSEVAPDSPLVAGVDISELGARPTLLDGLAFIERAADEDGAVVLISAMGARLVLPGIGRLTFEGARLRVSNPEKPRLDIDISFPTEAEAARFAQGCPGLKKQVISRVPWIARNITRMVVERLQCEASGAFVSVDGVYTEEEALRLLNIAIPFVPRPAVLNRLPPPPPKPKVAEGPTPGAGPDAGAAAPAAPSAALDGGVVAEPVPAPADEQPVAGEAASPEPANPGPGDAEPAEPTEPAEVPPPNPGLSPTP